MVTIAILSAFSYKSFVEKKPGKIGAHYLLGLSMHAQLSQQQNTYTAGEGTIMVG
jgi:hypothetical protein